eukprot:124781_1
MATAHSHIHSSIPSHSNPQSKPAPQPLSNVNKSSVSSTDASSNLNTVDEPSSVPHDSREKTCSATLNTEELQSDKQPTADSSDHKLDDTAHTDSKDTGDATVEHATHKESDDEGYVYDYNEDEKTLKVSYPWKADQTVPVFYLVTSRITDHCESSFTSFGYKTRAALSSTHTTIPSLWCLSSSLVSSTYSTNTTTPTNALKLSLYRVCFLASLILPLVPNCDVTNVFQMPDVLTSSANTSSTEHERMIATSVLTLFIACIALRLIGTIMVTVSSKPSISIEVEDTYGDNHDIDVTAKETEATKENESLVDIAIVPLVLAVAVAVLLGAALLVRYCFHIERRKRMQES